jgi:hypothetical protein
MRRPRTAAALLLLFPLSGCVFAVGVEGEDEADELRDRVRAMERRLERLEHAGVISMLQGHAVPGAEAAPAAPATAPEPVK